VKGDDAKCSVSCIGEDDSINHRCEGTKLEVKLGRNRLEKEEDISSTLGKHAELEHGGNKEKKGGGEKLRRVK